MPISAELLRKVIKQEHEYALMVLICCDEDLPIEVLKSAAGYYIGTQCPNCGPISRLSDCYYVTFVGAQEALDNGTFPLRTGL